jgi:ketosteroid isomerase-like protein
MKLVMRVLFIILLVTQCAFAQSSNATSPASGVNLLALERMWAQAQVGRDAAAAASMMGDRFINTEYDGEISDRAKFLADFADPKYQPSMMNVENMRVDMYTTTAVVTGNYHAKGTYGGKPYEHFGRFTDTWVFQDGKWLCVASHTSLIKK